MPNFRSIGPFKHKLGGGGRICPPPSIPICKKPGMFTLYNVCSVHRGVFSTLGDIMSTLGDIMSTLGDIMSTLGDIMSTSGDVQYIGGIP